MFEYLNPEAVHKIMNGCFGLLMNTIHIVALEEKHRDRLPAAQSLRL
jgi:hypothetical protein